jgi:diacylglycerol kinase
LKKERNVAKKEKVNMKRIAKSFYHAFRGIGYTLRYERNFQVECAVGGAVIVLMILLPLSRLEMVILLLTMALVMGMELVNTAMERVMDILKPQLHPYVRVVKDVMAGAVLLMAALAVIVGLLIFLPYFTKF